MQVIDVGEFETLARLYMLLTKFVRQRLLPIIVIKSTYFAFVTAHAVTFDSLVFVRMVKTLNRSVTLRALEAVLTVFPTHTVL